MQWKLHDPSALSFLNIQAQLPSSIDIVPIYDRSLTIIQNARDVQVTLCIAFVLVVMVIFIFLGRATDTLIPAVALPLSLLLTFVAMDLLGYSLDNLSLMALTLAIGFLVDDAIVFLENTVRLMETGSWRCRSIPEIRQGDQFHDFVHDAFPRGGISAAGVAGRSYRTHLPRVLHHHHGFHSCQRTGFADPDSVDVRQVAGPAWRGCEEDMDGARNRRG